MSPCESTHHAPGRPSAPGLNLGFDVDQITRGPAAVQVDRAIELINLPLQREPFGLGDQLFVHRDEIEVETHNHNPD